VELLYVLLVIVLCALTIGFLMICDRLGRRWGIPHVPRLHRGHGHRCRPDRLPVRGPAQAGVVRM